MLKIKDLHVNYGEFEALRGINLEIQEGEIVTLLGSNGAGKSTTINTVSGLNKVTKGAIEFKGQNIVNMEPSKVVELGLIQVPEGRKLFPSMTIHDNLLIGSYLKHTHAKRAETLDWCFDLFPILKERRNQLAGSLSGGEQQMCAISRALMSQPKLLMLDEPSLGLAPIIVERIFEVLKTINKNGTTILLVEQNALASLEIANRGYVIETGYNVFSGNSENLINDPKLRESYLGI